MVFDEIAEKNAWQKFWEKVGNFFMEPDTAGINYLTRILFAIGIIVVAWIFIKILTVAYKKSFKKKRKLDIDISAKSFIFNVVKIFLWLAVAFLVISVLKIEPTGIAGIASAITVALGLALQDVISCFACGVIILYHKNIKTGEYIEVKNNYGSCEGTVTKIHIFFTYLKTANGQEISVPNSNMLHAVVTNFTRLGMRRLNYDVGVGYETDIETAKKALYEVIADDKRVLQDQPHYVYVSELGSFAIIMRIRCWVKSEDYWNFLYEMSEKVLISCRKYNIRIPSSTDITVTKE
jgi:small conductance mechanosensitive channel